MVEGARLGCIFFVVGGAAAEVVDIEGSRGLGVVDLEGLALEVADDMEGESIESCVCTVADVDWEFLSSEGMVTSLLG